MTARLDAFDPMRETRVYGKGGQFQKGGGHIPGADASGSALSRKELEAVRAESYAAQREYDPVTYRVSEAVQQSTDALALYGGEGHRGINRTLRGQDVTPLDVRAAGGDVSKQVERLDAAFDHVGVALPANATVYRGVSLDVAAQMKPGAVFHDAGYMSTSTSRNAAAQFGQGGPVLEVRLRTGQRVVAAGERQETELLLPRGGQLRIVSVSATAIVAEYHHD